MKCAVLVVIGSLLLVHSSAVAADEKKVPLGEVPKPVLDAVKLKFPRAELKEAVKDVDDDETSFEISLLNAGKHITVTLDDEGEIEEIETEIALSELPKPVTDAIAGKYPKATLKKAEEVVEIEDGKEEKAYEVDVVTAEGKSVEVRVEASGKIEEDEADDG
jgi:Putative beta-lactamase-inhibitor-like, PepSY-like